MHPLLKWAAVAVLGAYLTGLAPAVEITDHCPGFSSPTPGAEHLCHSHLGPDAKSRTNPPDVPATQERHFVLRLANLRLSLIDVGF